MVTPFHQDWSHSKYFLFSKMLLPLESRDGDFDTIEQELQDDCTIMWILWVPLPSKFDLNLEEEAGMADTLDTTAMLYNFDLNLYISWRTLLEGGISGYYCYCWRPTTPVSECCFSRSFGRLGSLPAPRGKHHPKQIKKGKKMPL